MTKAVTELTEALLARFAEDEAVVEATISADLDRLHNDGLPDFTRQELLTSEGGYDASWLTRPIAECKAKRKLIELAFEVAAKVDGERGCCHSPEAIGAGLCAGEGLTTVWPFLKALELPYETTASE